MPAPSQTIVSPCVRILSRKKGSSRSAKKTFGEMKCIIWAQIGIVRSAFWTGKGKPESCTQQMACQAEQEHRSDDALELKNRRAGRRT